MSCVPIPAFPPLPDIFPLVLTPPTLPPIDLSIDLCCRFDLSIPLPIIPLGPLVLAVPGYPAIMLALNAVLDEVTSVIAALPLSCPFE
jgi:hypothetical protein